MASNLLSRWVADDLTIGVNTENWNNRVLGLPPLTNEVSGTATIHPRKVIDGYIPFNGHKVIDLDRDDVNNTGWGETVTERGNEIIDSSLSYAIYITGHFPNIESAYINNNWRALFVARDTLSGKYFLNSFFRYNGDNSAESHHWYSDDNAIYTSIPYHDDKLFGKPTTYCIVFDAVNSEVRMYNGNRLVRTDNRYYTGRIWPSRFTIGSSNLVAAPGAYRYFMHKGKLAEVRIYGGLPTDIEREDVNNQLYSKYFFNTNALPTPYCQWRADTLLIGANTEPWVNDIANRPDLTAYTSGAPSTRVVNTSISFRNHQVIDFATGAWAEKYIGDLQTTASDWTLFFVCMEIGQGTHASYASLFENYPSTDVAVRRIYGRIENNNSMMQAYYTGTWKGLSNLFDWTRDIGSSRPHVYTVKYDSSTGLVHMYLDFNEIWVDDIGFGLTAILGNFAVFGSQVDSNHNYTVSGYLAEARIYDNAVPEVELLAIIKELYTTYIEEVVDGSYVPGTEETSAVDSDTGSSTVTGGTLVTLSSLTPGATIRYTIDGSNPDNTSSIYTLPIVITETVTLKAYATLGGLVDSFIKQWDYVVLLITPVPAPLPFGGQVQYYQDVQLICEPGATIKYTLDGSDPTIASNTYGLPIIITADTTIKAYAYNTNQIDSDIVTSVYTIKAFDLDGLGTEASPYVIMDVEDFNQITYQLSAHYRLGDVIDFRGGYPNTMNVQDQFFGSINGDGFTIMNINFTRKYVGTVVSYMGIIPRSDPVSLATYDIFHDIRLVNCHIRMTGTMYNIVTLRVGLISGDTYTNTTYETRHIRAENCSVYIESSPGSRISRVYMGLLFGKLNSTSTYLSSDNNCTVWCKLPTSNGNTVGGLVGNVSGGDLSKSMSLVDITGSRINIFGAQQGTVIGGVAANTYNSISDCAFRGSIDDDSYTYTMSPGAKIRNYAIPIYTNYVRRWGWAHEAIPTTGYSTSYLDSESGYTDLEETDLNEVVNADMKIGATFIGWDFINIWGIDPLINEGFPFIRAIEDYKWKIIGALGGGGTSENPYLIYTQNNLSAIREYISEGTTAVYFKLMNDINMVGYAWEPMDTFNGVFDGNGFSILRLSYTGEFSTAVGVPAYHGLFVNTLQESDRVDKTTGIIKDLTFENTSFTLSGLRGVGEHTYVGGIVGQTDKIDSHTALSKVIVKECSLNVSSNGYVNASFFIGGIVGKVNGINDTVTRKVIHRCSVNIGDINFSGDSAVNLDSFIGVVVGSQGNGYCRIDECYSRYTAVTVDKGIGAEFNIGGILGLSGSTLHISDNMKSVSNCFSRNLKVEALNSKPVRFGGIVGSGYASLIDTDKRVIDDCYSIPLIMIDASYGGVVGYHIGLDTSTMVVDTCYYDEASTGAVLPISTIINEQSQDDTTTSNSMSQQFMKDRSQYIGWDFEGVWAISIAINDGYPFLRENELELDEGGSVDIIVVNSPCPPVYEGSTNSIFLLNRNVSEIYPHRNSNCAASVVCTPIYTRTVYDSYCGWVSGYHSSLVDYTKVIDETHSIWGAELLSQSGVSLRNLEVDSNWIYHDYGMQDSYDLTCKPSGVGYNLAWDKWVCKWGQSIRNNVPRVANDNLISAYGNIYHQNEEGDIIKTLVNGVTENLGNIADGAVWEIKSGTLKLPDGILYYGDYIYTGGDFNISPGYKDTPPRYKDLSGGRVGDVFFIPETTSCYEKTVEVFPGGIGTGEGMPVVIGCARNFIVRKDQEVLRSENIDELGTDPNSDINFIARTSGVTVDDLSYKLISEGGILYDKSGVTIDVDGNVNWSGYIGLDIDKPLLLEKYYITTAVTPETNVKYAANIINSADLIEELYGPEDNEFGVFGTAGRLVLENGSKSVLMIQVKPSNTNEYGVDQYRQAIDRLQLKVNISYIIPTFPARLLSMDVQREIEDYLYTHVQLMNNHARERGVMVGTTSLELNGTGITDSLDAYSQRAKTLSNEYVSFAVPSKTYRNGILYDSSIIAAALAGAKSSTKYVSTPIHGKELLGFTVAEDKYTDFEVSQLTSNGCCVARTVNGITKVDDVITTDLTSADTQELSVVAIKWLVKRTIRKGLSNIFLKNGLTITVDTLDNVAAGVNSILGVLIKDREILEFGTVDNIDTGERKTIAIQDPDEPRLVNIVCSYKPLYPLKWIEVKARVFI